VLQKILEHGGGHGPSSPPAVSVIGLKPSKIHLLVCGACVKIATVLELKKKYEMPSYFSLYLKKKKLNKNCTSLLAYVKQWMDVFENLVLQ
jgi:hypothetical protein